MTVARAEQRFPIRVDIVTGKMMMQIIKITMNHRRVQVPDFPIHNRMTMHLQIIHIHARDFPALIIGKTGLKKHEFPQRIAVLQQFAKKVVVVRNEIGSVRLFTRNNSSSDLFP